MLIPRQKLCCCNRRWFLLAATKVIFLSDVIWLAFYLYLYIDGQKIDIFNEPFDQKKIMSNFLLVASPLFVLEVIKTYFGFVCWRADFSRSSFIQYYNISWTYYVSYSIQQSIVLVSTSKVIV